MSPLHPRDGSPLDALIAALPNQTLCPTCGGAGRRASLGAISRLFLKIDGDPNATEPCSSCHGTGARHCDYGCGRMADRYSLEVERLICGLCDIWTRPKDEPCAECVWSEPDEVLLPGGASFRCALYCPICGARCCSETCATQHQKRCPPRPTKKS